MGSLQRFTEGSKKLKNFSKGFERVERHQVQWDFCYSGYDKKDR